MVKRPGPRVVSFGDRKRITKEDGKIATLAKTKSSRGVVIPEVKKVMLRRKNESRSLHRTNIIFPSEMARGDWCPRATYYRMCDYPEPASSTSFTLENVFSEGNAIHLKWQNWLSDSGLLWGDWKCSRCGEYVRDSIKPEDRSFGDCVGTGWIDLSKHVQGQLDRPFPHDWKYKEVTLKSTTLPISGHADGALIVHNTLIELKSLGIGTLRFEAPKLLEDNTYEVSGKKILDIEGIWKNFHKPLLAHIRQGNIYLWMAEQNGLPFDKISFVYEFKANQQAKEFVVSKSDEILNPMLETAELVRKAVDSKTPPACPFGGCSSCKAYEK